MSRRMLLAVAVLVLAVGGAIGARSVWASGASAHPDEPASLLAYSVEESGLGGVLLNIWVGAGDAPVFTLWSVSETPQRVEVSVRQRTASGAHTDKLVPGYRLTWPLHAPVGARIVVDAFTGKELRRSSSS